MKSVWVLKRLKKYEKDGMNNLPSKQILYAGVLIKMYIKNLIKEMGVNVQRENN